MALTTVTSPESEAAASGTFAKKSSMERLLLCFVQRSADKLLRHSDRDGRHLTAQAGQLDVTLRLRCLTRVVADVLRLCPGVLLHLLRNFLTAPAGFLNESLGLVTGLLQDLLRLGLGIHARIGRLFGVFKPALNAGAPVAQHRNERIEDEAG